MTPEVLTRKYFYPGTRGYIILRNYFAKYRDLFIKTLHHEFDEFLNQVLLNVSSIKFTDEIKNVEAYVIGTIKIQCRVQLDKAIKAKAKIQKQQSLLSEEDDDEGDLIKNIPSDNPDAQEIIEQQEIFRAVNLFKVTLKTSEIELLNNLIDEVPRMEIAEKRQQNLNTLDTQIRRLRIKFLEYLNSCGYSFKMFEKLRNH